MALKPWYKVVTPREDLREGKPLDASEFAVHLDHVRAKTAHPDYTEPERFFSRTYMTQNLLTLSGEVVRRLSGVKTETSAVFNLATQFGGGKTHALTLLYHLAKNGDSAKKWAGVEQIMTKAGIPSIPKAAMAVFVGTEFDSLTGRGGNDGTPLRKTPWGEIAFQLGGEEAFALVSEHEKALTAPSGEVIRKLFPKNKPSLILMDELMNYVSRNRKIGLGAQMYHFLQNLSEVVRSQDNVVLAVSIPASELEMTAEDMADYDRFKKLLDRLGKAIIMSAEDETSEIIRRRLFEWDDRAITSEGKVMLTKDAIETCEEFGKWVIDHRQQLPTHFNVDRAQEVFSATYPFHPAVFSVFERKWQELPRFQQTRGVLRLLALWVSKAYSDGFKGDHKDSLIGLGTAPLDDPMFRSAVFEQLGEAKLEGAVTTDICGKKDSHALRLDAEAQETIKKARLHRKVATTVFFESNGGQAKTEATQPEVRYAVAEPSVDIGNVETALEALSESCYYMTVERNRYRFSLKENLNKRFVDRRASIQFEQVDEYVKEEIQKVFSSNSGIECVMFPEKTIQVSHRTVVTLVVLSPDHSFKEEKQTRQFIETLIRECGSSSRTFKSALFFSVPESGDSLREEARKVLAWEAIADEASDLKLDEQQINQLKENIKKSQRDMRESIWRTYNLLGLLNKDNTLKIVDLGLIHSSQAPDIMGVYLDRLQKDGDLTTGVSPNFLTRNWPPAFKEWPTKSVADAFFASPQFPRLTNAEIIKDTIVRGVGNSQLAYVGKSSAGEYKPFYFNRALMMGDIEFSNDMFIITKETAEAYSAARAASSAEITDVTQSSSPVVTPPSPLNPTLSAHDPQKPAGDLFSKSQDRISKLAWTGEIPAQKWMNFYTKVLSKFASTAGLKLKLSVEVSPIEGVSKQKADETRAALRELGLDDRLNLE